MYTAGFVLTRASFRVKITPYRHCGIEKIVKLTCKFGGTAHTHSQSLTVMDTQGQKKKCFLILSNTPCPNSNVFFNTKFHIFCQGGVDAIGSDFSKQEATLPNRKWGHFSCRKLKSLTEKVGRSTIRRRHVVYIANRSCNKQFLNPNGAG